MFYFLAIISMIGYGVQVALLAHISRTMDALDIGFYRNISFIVTLSPLLLFASFEEISAVSSHFPELAIMSIAAVLSMWASFASFKFLPVGVSLASKRVLTIVFLFLMGLFFLGETLTLIEGVLILIAIGAIVFLAIQKNEMPHLDSRSLMGFALLLLAAIPSAITFFMVGNLARVINPLVAGYAWEFSIAIATSFTVLFRYLFTKKKLERVSWKKFEHIAVAAFPTLIGTGAYAMAVNLGPIVLVAAIALGMVPVAALVARFRSQEKLSQMQWAGITVTLVAIAALKFV